MRTVQVYEKNTGAILVSVEDTEEVTRAVLRDGLAVRVDGEDLEETSDDAD